MDDIDEPLMSARVERALRQYVPLCFSPPVHRHATDSLVNAVVPIVRVMENRIGTMVANLGIRAIEAESERDDAQKHLKHVTDISEERREVIDRVILRAEKAEAQVLDLSAELAAQTAGRYAAGRDVDATIAKLQQHLADQATAYSELKDGFVKAETRADWASSRLEVALKDRDEAYRDYHELFDRSNQRACDLASEKRVSDSLRRTCEKAYQERDEALARLGGAVGLERIAEHLRHERDDYRQALENERAGTRSLPLSQAITSIRERAAYNRKRAEEAEKTDPELSVRKYVRAETLESVVHLLELVTPEQPKVCPPAKPVAPGTVEALKEACRLIFGREADVRYRPEVGEAIATLKSDDRLAEHRYLSDRGEVSALRGVIRQALSMRRDDE